MKDAVTVNTCTVKTRKPEIQRGWGIRSKKKQQKIYVGSKAERRLNEFKRKKS